MTGSIYHTDYWSKYDLLHFSDFRPVLGGILLEADTPLTIGIFGAWGSGKTTMLKMLQRDIESKGSPDFRTVWFTAWKYDKEEALWRALLLRVIDALYPRENTDDPWEQRPRLALDQLTQEQNKQVAALQRLEESIYERVTWQETGKLSINWWQALTQTGKAGAEIATALFPPATAIKPLLDVVGGTQSTSTDFEKTTSAIRRELHEYHREQLVSIEQFEDAFRAAISLALGKEGRLIIFVDDLDRCLPEKALEVLETIKLFLEASGTIFVLGMDKDVIERGIETRYKAQFNQSEFDSKTLPVTGDDYLQKIIQIPFYLPPMGEEDVLNYVESLERKDLIEEQFPRDILSRIRRDQITSVTRIVISRGVVANPRQIKRIINIFRLLQAIALVREYRGSLPQDSVAWPLLAKTVIIQTQYPELYREWRREPNLVPWLEDAFTNRKKATETTTDSTQADLGAGSVKWRYVEQYVKPENWQKYMMLEKLLSYPSPEVDKGGRDRACFMNLAQEDIAIYLRLSGSTAMETARATLIGEYWQSIEVDNLEMMPNAIDRIKESASKEQVENIIWLLVRKLKEPGEATPEVLRWARALSGLGRKDQAILALGQLRLASTSQKISVIDLLTEFGDSSIPLLNKLYNENFPETQKAIIDSLGKIGTPTCTGLLLEKATKIDQSLETSFNVALESSYYNADATNRQSILKTLGSMSNGFATDFLVDVLDFEDGPEIKTIIIKLLSTRKSKTILPVLLKQINDETPKIQEALVDALVWCGEPSIKPIIKLICEGDGTSPSFSLLTKVLIKLGCIDEAQIASNQQEIHSLFPNEDRNKANLLTLLLEHRNPNISRTANVILRQNGILITETLIQLLAQRDKKLEPVAKLILEDEKAVDSLAHSIDMSDWWTKIEIAKILGQIGTENTVKPLVRLLEDATDEVAEATIHSLVVLGTQNIQWLIPYLGHHNPEVRTGIIVALGKIGEPSAIKHLNKVVKNDKSQAVKERAKEVIGEIEDINADSE